MKLQHGDIFAVDMDGILRKILGSLTTPHTKMYHFGMIGPRVGNDHDILESLIIDPIDHHKVYWDNIRKNSVVRGKLSRYRGIFVTIIRQNIPNSGEAGVKAWMEMGQLRSAGYDVEGIVAKILKMITKKGKPPWNYETVVNNPREKYTCIGAVSKAWERAGYPIINPGVFPTPSAVVDSINNGRLRVVFEGVWP